MKKHIRLTAISIILWLPLVGLFLALLLLFGASFMTCAEIAYIYLGDKTLLRFLPRVFSFTQYRHILFETPEFLFKFWNSFLLTLPILLGLLTVSTLGGYGFAKYRFLMKKPLFFIMMVVMMLPYQVTLVPNFIVLNRLNLIGSRWAVILPNIFNPFGVFLMHQFMLKVPDETIETARVEGAGELRIFLRIVLPQASAGIAALAVLNVLDTWNMVEQPLVLLQNEAFYPLSIALNAIAESGYGTVFSCSVVFLIPLLLSFLAGKDALTEGIDKSRLL
jgi:multiple sugar transport system permease protein